MNFFVKTCIILKICYFVCPQGQLLNDLDKAITDHGREDMPLPEIVSRTKSVVTRLQEMTKEQLAADLYFVETFISDRRRSVLKNIQDNYEKFVLTLDRFSLGNYDGIKVVNVIDWLLG